MAEPLISVIVPTHNRAHLICRAIDSALAQSGVKLEILVIDDGSSDHTAEVIRTRYGTEGRVRYHWKANGGAGSARNEGMALAAGEWLAFLDSDDQWKPWKLALQMQCASRFPDLDLLWTDMDAVASDGRLVKSRYINTFYDCYKHLTLREIFTDSVPLADIVSVRPAELEGERFFWGDVFPSMFMGNIIHTSTAVLRREVALKVPGGFNPSFGQWGEDYDFFLRCTAHIRVGFITAPAILYQVGEQDQATHRQFCQRVARNCYSSIAHILTTPRGRRDIPKALIRKRLAHVHSWTAEVLMDDGEYASARTELLKSLRYRLWQPAYWKQFLIASLPFGLGQVCRRGYRAAKGGLQTCFGGGPTSLTARP